MPGQFCDVIDSTTISRSSFRSEKAPPAAQSQATTANVVGDVTCTTKLPLSIEVRQYVPTDGAADCTSTGGKTRSEAKHH